MTPIHYEIYRLGGYVWELVTCTTRWTKAWMAQQDGLTVIEVDSMEKTRRRWA